MSKHEHSGDVKDLDLAISGVDEAMKLITPSSRDRVQVLSSAAACHEWKYKRTGSLGDLDLSITREERPWKQHQSDP